MKTKSNGCTGKLPRAFKKQVDQIVSVVISEFGVDADALFGGNRKPETCWARWVMFKHMLATGMTQDMVGGYTGYTHSAVSSGVSRLEHRLQQSDEGYDVLRVLHSSVRDQLRATPILEE